LLLKRPIEQDLLPPHKTNTGNQPHDQKPGIGLSIGSAEVEDHSEDLMAHIGVADERMYENKRALRRRGQVAGR
jgi:hypothetical protein